MKQIGKLLILGMTVMFLLQSCVTMHRSRHHYHRRHCFVVIQPRYPHTAAIPSFYRSSQR